MRKLKIGSRKKKEMIDTDDMDIKTVKSKVSEVKSFVIKQMKKSDWGKEDNVLTSKYVKIYKNDDGFRIIVMVSNRGYDNISTSPKELGISWLRFFLLLLYVKRSAKQFKERQRKLGIAYKWDQFLEKNKDINRDNKLDKLGID